MSLAIVIALSWFYVTQLYHFDFKSRSKVQTMNASVLWDIVSRAKIEWHVPQTEWHSILRGTGRFNPKDTSVHCLTVLEHGHTHEKFRFRVQIVFLHFNFLVLTLKSCCYFVYDIFAIVPTPLSCTVLKCFTAWFITVDA